MMKRVLRRGEGVGKLTRRGFSPEINDTSLRGIIPDHNEYIMKGDTK